MKHALFTIFFLVFSISLFGQKDTLDVNELEANFTAKKGDIITYTGTQHASVGIGFEIDADSKYLKYLKSEMTYEHDQETAGNGGDGGWVTYYYEVIAEGETKIHIRKDFRGETQGEYDIKLKLIK